MMRKFIMIILLSCLPWAMPMAEAGNGISEQEFVDFLATLPTYPSADEGRKTVDSLVSTIGSDYTQLDNVLDWAAKYLLNERSPLRNSELYDSLFVMDMPGRKALNFNFCDTLGHKSDFYSFVKSDSKTLLFFYSPDCDHCLKLLHEWHANPSSIPKLLSGNRVLAVSLLDDKELWHQSIALLPKGWLPVCDLDYLLVHHRYDLRHLPHIVSIKGNHICEEFPSEQKPIRTTIK